MWVEKEKLSNHRPVKDRLTIVTTTHLLPLRLVWLFSRARLTRFERK